MIKRLRIQFISITLSLIALLLAIIFLLICSSTWSALSYHAHSAMQEAYTGSLRPGRADTAEAAGHPCFVLYLDPAGNLCAYGSAYYDLTDTEALCQILFDASATGNSGGVLRQWELRFLVKDVGGIRQYVFMDISRQLQYMENLVIVCVITFCIAMTGFFLVVLLLSRWITKPVETAWDQQRQFVADASHELKTPLTVILTNAELLQSSDYTPQDKDRFIGSIHIMAGQMRGLVENLLELARLDHHLPQKQMQTVDFSTLAEDSILHFEPVYFEAGRELVSQVQPGLQVCGSMQHLHQVVNILLDNGCKYSAPGSQVQLTLTAHHRHGVLQVSSQGAAMTGRQCKDIFKRFYRADEARSGNGSYGLGLPIAQAIVSEHRGKIWATSKNGVNTFTVSLPLKK